MRKKIFIAILVAISQNLLAETIVEPSSVTYEIGREGLTDKEFKENSSCPQFEYDLTNYMGPNIERYFPRRPFKSTFEAIEKTPGTTFVFYLNPPIKKVSGISNIEIRDTKAYITLDNKVYLDRYEAPIHLKIYQTTWIKNFLISCDNTEIASRFIRLDEKKPTGKAWITQKNSNSFVINGLDKEYEFPSQISNSYGIYELDLKSILRSIPINDISNLKIICKTCDLQNQSDDPSFSSLRIEKSIQADLRLAASNQKELVAKSKGFQSLDDYEIAGYFSSTPQPTGVIGLKAAGITNKEGLLNAIDRMQKSKYSQEIVPTQILNFLEDEAVAKKRNTSILSVKIARENRLLEEEKKRIAQKKIDDTKKLAEWRVSLKNYSAECNDYKRAEKECAIAGNIKQCIEIKLGVPADAAVMQCWQAANAINAIQKLEGK